MKIQAELVKRQTELSSGRLADVGLSLGAGTRETTSLRQSQAWLDAVSGSNALAMARLDTSQSALSGIVQTAQSMQDQLVGAMGSVAASSGVTQSAKTALGSLISQLNTSISGVYVFGGDNGAPQSVADYFAPGAVARQGIAQDFATAFGMPADSSGVSAITPAAMGQFLDGVFADRFNEATWASEWSQASTTNPTARIATGESVEIGANADESPFRQLAEAYVMVSELGSDKLSPDTYNAMITKAVGLVGKAIAGVAGIQSRLGTSQERISAADNRLSEEGTIITNRLGKLEQADPYAASTAINELMTKLQASFAVTARLQQLSILNYM